MTAMEPAATPGGGVKFACPYCGQHIEAGKDLLGVSATCPTCGQTVTIPARDRFSTKGILEFCKTWVMPRWKRLGQLSRIYGKTILAVLKSKLNKCCKTGTAPDWKRVGRAATIYCKTLLLVLRKQTHRGSLPQKWKQWFSSKWKGLKLLTQIGWISLATAVSIRFFFNSGGWFMVLACLIGMIALFRKPRLQAVVLLIACAIAPFKYYKDGTYESNTNASQGSVDTGNVSADAAQSQMAVAPDAVSADADKEEIVLNALNKFAKPYTPSDDEAWMMVEGATPYEITGLGGPGASVHALFTDNLQALGVQGSSGEWMLFIAMPHWEGRSVADKALWISNCSWFIKKLTNAGIQEITDEIGKTHKGAIRNGWYFAPAGDSGVNVIGISEARFINNIAHN